jgi:SSS family solute:Na+ symporter
MLWAIYFAIVVKTWDEQEGSGIYSIFQTLMAFFQGPALAVLLTGILWRRATGRAAFVAFIVGVLTSIGLFALNQESVYQPLGLQPIFKVEDPFLYLTVWAFLVSMLLLIVGSYLTRPEPEEKVRGLIYHDHARSRP